MPVQQFSTYDIIVDIIPGATFLVLLYAVVPISENGFLISNPIAIGSVLLLGGYFTGRLIHGISGYSIDSLLHADRNWLRESVVTAIQLSSFSLALHLTNKIIKLYRKFSLTDEEDTQDGNNDSKSYSSDKSGIKTGYDHQIDAWFAEDYSEMPDSVDEDVVSRVSERLEGRMHDKNTNLHPKAKRRYGESILYGKGTLYMKYQMLSIFFRNAMLVTVLMGLLYLTTGGLAIMTDRLDQKLLQTQIRLQL